MLNITRFWLQVFANIIDPRYQPLASRYEDVPTHVTASGEPTVLEKEDRKIITSILRRPFRDRAFASAIKSAYEDTCAVSGIRIINGRVADPKYRRLISSPCRTMVPTASETVLPCAARCTGCLTVD